MLAHLTDASIRSLLLAVVAAAVLSILRSRKTAALEHAVWAAVVCGMLALFAFGQALPRLPLRILDTPGAAPALERFSQPTLYFRAPEARVQPVAPAPVRRPFDWGSVVLATYGTIAFAFLVRFSTGMFLVRRLWATARETGRTAVYESAGIAVPVTVGWLRPRILLPPDWREWNREKLEAVLAHEGAHIRRRDGLAAALAAVNRCLFWFHPLAWILERKLALAADQACDEFCVAMLGDRERYARLLLDMARMVDGSLGRLQGHAVTMAASYHISRRIESLLREGRTFSRGLTRAGSAAMALCAIPVILAAAGVELDHLPPFPRLEMPRLQTPPAPQPILIAQAQTPAAPKPKPKFDSATVKPCSPADGVGHTGRGGGPAGRGMGHEPGYFWVNCLSVRELIDIAAAQFAEPLANDSTTPMALGRIRGGPDWAESDYFSIDAETNNPVVANQPAPGPGAGRDPGMVIMAGPMLQSLLEDRFHLQSHREVEQVPMYALTVAPGGVKLKAMEEGGCAPFEGGPFTWAPGKKPPCRWTGWVLHGANQTVEGGGVPFSRLAETLGDLIMDRHVVDQTGVSEIFNIHLEYTPDEHTPLRYPGPPREIVDPSEAAPAPTIFNAIEQQLGLKLESIEGPHGYIVIDHVERP
jgi:uncharacterized protein (TIGR03435 family)